MVSAIGKGRQGVEHVSGSSWEKNTKAECWRGPRKQCLKKKKKKKKKILCPLAIATEQGRGTVEGSATSQQVPGCELN